MIKIIYKKLPINEITYLNRKKDGFSAEGVEKNFYNSLKASISKHGIKDPVYIEYGGESYGDVLKIIVGNNRVAIAHELGIKEIPCIIKNFKADIYDIKGTILNTDEEIKKYFYLPNQLQIRRDEDNNIDQIMPPWYIKVMDQYV
jgi:ParB-like chromosome segregation protein Spo0J